MKGPLLKLFIYWFIGMAALLVLYAFFGPKGRAISLEEINFKTTQSSELYFRNMRSYFYDREEHQESNYHIYRLGSRNRDSLKLSFMILHNWRMNEAYVMAESDLLDIEKDGITILAGGKDSLQLNLTNAEENYVYAAKLYGYISNEERLELIVGSKAMSFSESELKTLRTELKDYFKLVGKLR